MNLKNLQALAVTPRQMTEELKAVTSPQHPLYQLGWQIGAVSVLLLVGGVVAAALHYIGWSLLAIPAVGLIVGIVLSKATKGMALRANEDKIANAPLGLTAVVQANNDLYNPDSDSTYPAVLVWSTSPGRMFDIAWLQQLAAKLAACKEGDPKTYGEGLVYQRLIAETSSFHDEQLPEDLTGDANTYWTVETITQSELPNNVIPEDGVLPYFFQKKDNGVLSAYKIVPKALWA